MVSGEEHNSTHWGILWAMSDEPQAGHSDPGASRRAWLADPDQLRALLSVTLDGFLLADFDGRIVDANQAYCRLVGYELEELLAMNVAELDAMPETVPERIARIRREGRARFQTAHRHKDGRPIQLDVSICAIEGADRPLVAAFARDLTEQRRASIELRDSALLLEKAQQLAHLGIWRWDVRANRVTWSKELYRIYGLDSDTFGASFEAYLQRVHPADRERVHATVREALVAKLPFEFGERIVRPDGEVRHLRSWGGVVVAPEGHVEQLFGACLDVTEQHIAEEELRAAHAELEARVAKRTEELARAKERAVAADRAKSAFLATMSHELRTPLNSIIGFTSIIRARLAGPLTDEQDKQLGMVARSAQHLLGLINDVLDISKIEAGEVELDSRPFDIRKMIGDAVGMVRPMAAKKALTLSVEIADAVGEVVGDERRLQQILINLLTNAVKFTESGGVALRAWLEGDELHLSVQDTGTGIKEDDIEKLFSPFSQIDTGLTRRHDGTGLGLAISCRLARMMGGTITVDTQWGVGSTFEVVIPRSSA